MAIGFIGCVGMLRTCPERGLLAACGIRLCGMVGGVTVTGAELAEAEEAMEKLTARAG